jgi:hypothetical protein
MPNWVYNRLTVSGDRESLELFIERNRSERADGDILDFNRLAPLPPEHRVKDEDPGTGLPAWYTWRLENWGTKWNADVPTIEGDPARGEITYAFATAWTPPDAWIATASAAFCTLKLHHECAEELLHFAGKADWLAGEIVQHTGVDPEELDWFEIE